MKKNTLKFNDKALSPILSTLLVIAISIAVVASALLWGLPFIEGQKRDSQVQNSENDFIGLEGSISNLLQIPSNSSYGTQIAYISNSHEKGSVNVRSSGDRMILWYSRDSSILNFTVTGLDDGDDEFTVTTQRGVINHVAIYWLNDTGLSNPDEMVLPDTAKEFYDFPYDTIDYINTSEEPAIMDGPNGDEYTIESGSVPLDFEGAVQIDLFNNNYHPWSSKPVNATGRIFLFDLGAVFQDLPYSNGLYQTFYQNGAVFSIDGETQKAEFVDEPEIYENRDKNLLGFRVVLVRNGPDNAGGVGQGRYMVRTQMRRFSNFMLESEYNTSFKDVHGVNNLSVQFYGDNSEYWSAFFKSVYGFEDKGTHLVYNKETTDLVLLYIVIRAEVLID